jgi:hypothetical protein
LGLSLERDTEIMHGKSLELLVSLQSDFDLQMKRIRFGLRGALPPMFELMSVDDVVE